MLVRFINRGWKTNDGMKEVDVVATELNEFTNAPQLRIANPWWTGDTLVCEWTNNEWVCDLDQEETMSVQETLEEIDSKLDEVDALVMSMPLQDSVKRDLVKHIYTMYAELEEAVELRPADFNQEVL